MSSQGILTINKGSTFGDTLQWATSECVLKDIASVTQTAPVVLNCTNHGVPDGWAIKVESHPNIDSSKTLIARVIDEDTLEIPCMNGTQFDASSAVLRYNMPVDLFGYTARMQIRDSIGGELLMTLTTENGKISIDAVNKKIKRNLTASETASINWSFGVYDLEMISNGYVIKIDSGTVNVIDEVTV